MNPLRWFGRLSSRVHLALGLAGLAVGLVLSAGLLGLVVDGEAMTRSHRAALAETVALVVSGQLDQLDASEPQRLYDTLDVVRQRNPGMLSIGVRDAEGALLIDVEGHAGQWPEALPTEASTDSRITVPLFLPGQVEPWGRVELRFEPLRQLAGQGWMSHLEDPGLRLTMFVFGMGTLMFWLYLGRMLRELDPSRAVPPRVRAAYDTLTEGLLVLDRDGRIVLANKSTARMLGLDENQLVGRRPAEFGWALPDGTTLAATDLPWARALASDSTERDVHLTVARPDGARFALRTNCSPIMDDKGHAQALVVSFQDVTELERRGEALREAKDQADAANEAKSQFLANMSHEIRTPMNAIIGFTDVLRRGGLRNGTDAAKHLDIIHSSGRHLLNLINDILDLSKVESGRFEAERIDFAPHVVAHEVIATLLERAQAKNLTLEMQATQAMPATLEGDPARLRQILTNLIGNAIKFTERGGVTLRLRLQDAAAGGPQRYCLDVVDTGIGIAADKLESVFEPFVQAEASTTRRFGGTGLGLTISRGFARAMGGDIVATSVPGQGTTFSVWFDIQLAADTPLLAPADLLQAATPAAAHAGAQRWRFPAARVLVVDDGEHNRSLVRLLLEDVGLQVEEAENGRIALDRMAEGDYQLVLMDMQMPEMDGSTATSLLRQRGCTVPIVALTANAMKGFERELEASGFTGYQTKPIDRDVLIEYLAGLLGGEALGAETADDGHGSAESAYETPPAAPQDQTPIVSRLAGHARLQRVVTGFVHEFGLRLPRMHAMLAAGDHVELAAQAHWLKGSGGSMGFDDLYEPALALEAAAQAGDEAAAGQLLALLDQLAARIRSGQPGAAPDTPPAQIDNGQRPAQVPA